MRRILVMDLDLYIYESSSLKDKRKIKNMILDKLRNKYNLSVIESDKQDTWNLISLTISYVALDNSHAINQEQKIKLYIEDLIEALGYISQYHYEIY